MRVIEAPQFARELKYKFEKNKNSHFAFFLGAGCSVSSGIPASKELVRLHWLPELKKIEEGTENNASLDEWATGRFAGYSPEIAGIFYGQVIEALFTTDHERQNEISRLTEGKDPSFGYAVLAQLISHPGFSPRCNTIITTNFDDMVADALYLYTNKKPLVIAHDSLIGFVRRNRVRPLVLKLHGDARLEPKNTDLEVARLDEAVQKTLEDLLIESGLVFIGYGGNDIGISKALSQIPDKTLPWGVYWVNSSAPSSEFAKWLDTRKSTWVKLLDFDELMLLLHNEFEFDHPDMRRFVELEENYRITFKHLSEKIKNKAPSRDKQILEASLEKAAKQFDNWYSVVFEADKYKEANPDKANQVFLDGLREFEDNATLCGEYAIFLKKIRKDYDAAEEYYRRALQADPTHATNLGNFALFLHEIRSNYDEAENLYQRAIQADPTDPYALGNFALFLDSVRKDYDAAEEYYKRAMQADPTIANNLGNYAFFLKKIRKEYDASEEYFRLALQTEPTNSPILDNYAFFLETIRKDYGGAEEYYQRAMEAGPQRANSWSSYAHFLEKVRKDYIAAEEYYRRALEVDLMDANTLGNYAGFLFGRSRFNEGEQYLDRALDLASYEPLQLECWFYAYAHKKRKHDQKHALSKIKTLVFSKVRSPGWDLTDNVTRAVETGHPEPKMLAILAKVIAEEADAKKLEKFDAWRNV